MSDVKEAAERLRRVYNGEDLCAVYRPPQSSLWTGRQRRLSEIDLSNDRSTLAAEYLSEHPADSDEPIKADWLRAVGFEPGEHHDLRLKYSKPYGEDTCTFELVCGDPENISDCGWEISAQSVELSRECCLLPCEPATRGDLRRLAFAFRIELKEPTP